MADQARVPNGKNHRKAIDEARMARVRLASERLQRALGLYNNTTPCGSLPNSIGPPVSSNERLFSSDVIRLGPAISDKDLQTSKVGEVLRHGLDDAHEDNAAIPAQTSSLSQIGVGVTTADPRPGYLPPPATPTACIPIERELYDRLNSYLESSSATKTDLVSLSIHDLTPEKNTGLHQNVLLMHVEAGEGRSLTVFEVTIPAMANVSEAKSGRWIYFVIELQGGMWTMFACPIEAVEKVSEGKETVQKDGGKKNCSLTTKCCAPALIVTPLRSLFRSHITDKWPHLPVRKEYIRVELDMCSGGLPLFDGSDIPAVPWLGVVKAMASSTCRVRYLYEQKKASSKVGKS
ncbi:MAG: hypothetical protein M1836_005872 [Candelina mexicana]|nr:MAG: hypothetical protein M1836_005872 [Candelina mexicana]